MKVPTHAKKVFSGIRFDVYHWQEVDFNGKNMTWEGLKRKPSAQMFVQTQEGKWIYLHEEQPGNNNFTSIPGGLIESDEEPLDGAKRELLEETGMTGDFTKLGTYEFQSSKIEWLEHNYLVTNAKRVQEPKLDHGEKIRIELLDLDELKKRTNDTSFRNTRARKYLHMLK